MANRLCIWVIYIKSTLRIGLLGPIIHIGISLFGLVYRTAKTAFIVLASGATKSLTP